MRSLIDIVDFSVEELQGLLDTACDIIANPEKYRESCRYKKLATLFFEPSTRTRLSFEAAMLELGGSVIGFSEASSSSAAKGESVADTAKMISCYADIMAMRHPKEGAPYVAARAASIPVINAGDGGHCHPTQTLADLLTIYREHGHFDGLTVGCCGDLKYGRTVHSLISALSRLSIALCELILGNLPLGFTDLMYGYFRMLSIGYGLYTLGNVMMLLLLYFTDYSGALLCTFFFAVAATGLTIASLWLPVAYYGVGFMGGAAVFYAASLLRLSWFTRRLPYHILARQPIVAMDKRGVFTKIGVFLERSQRRKMKHAD